MVKLILVTGCAGFIGSHLCEKLLKLNYKLIGIDNLDPYYSIKQKNINLQILSKYENFTFYEEDIVNTKLVEIKKPNIIIHLAAKAGVRNSIENPTDYVRTNVQGTMNLLNQSVKYNIEHFIYASSSSIYGTNKKVPFSENDKIDNINSPYAATKKSCEILAQMMNQLYNIKITGLRFFTVYGPRGRPDMAPFKFLNNIYKGTKFDKYGNGETFRDYTYIDDIVNGIIASINRKGQDNQVYNLGNSMPISLNKFIEICEEVTGKKAVFNQLPDQLGDVPKTYADIYKAQKDFNYKPNISFKEGLKNTFEWLKIF